MAGAQEIQTAAMNFANTATQNMVTMSNNAIFTNFPNVPDPSDFLGRYTVGGYGGGMLTPPGDVALPAITAELPAAPVLAGITIPTLQAPPDFVVAAPIITIPAAPSAQLPASPGQAPTFNAPVLPDKPNFTLPEVPTFAPVAVPTMPAVALPTFNSTLPVDDIVEPSERFSFAEQPYQSAMLDALKVKLMADLSNGGYGIETSDESALWERARERELRAAEAAIQDATRQAASRGFSMPQGALNALIQQAQQNAQEKNSSLSRDIALKRADLYAENRKFTITQVRELETTLIGYTAQMAERALNTAKSMVELSIASFNARVARYNLRMEAHKVRAQVYETLVRGALMQLEAYKTEVEAARLSMDIQKVHTEVYKTQIDGVNSLIGLYTAEAGAAKLLADIERTKMDTFKASVEAYTAQVGAKNAEFAMFEAQIKGEMTKMDVYKTQVQSYGATVDSFKTKAEIGEISLRAQIAGNEAQLSRYKMDISRYSAELEKSQLALATTSAKYDGDIKKYSVVADATMRASEQNIQAAKANADVMVARAKMLGDYTISKANVLNEQSRSYMTVQGSLAAAYGAVASAALNQSIGITSNNSSL